MFRRTSISGEQPNIKVCPSCHALMRDDVCQICRFQPGFSKKLTLLEYFMGHNVDPRYRGELSEQIIENATDLLERANSLLDALTKANPSLGMAAAPIVTSGWRPRAINQACGGAPNSNHLHGKAIDLLDPGHQIGEFLRANQQLLRDRGLAIEEPTVCNKPGGQWVHIQNVIPASGHLIFIP